MKYLTRKQARLTQRILSLLLKILFGPALVLLCISMVLTYLYMCLDDLTQEKLYWIIQGESTDFNVRLRKCIDNAK